jgi:cytochrome c biogenesis protein CcmG/thiol:disulfide interchange protein DsbE
MSRFVIPLAIFIVLVAFLAIGLGRDPREVPSPLIGKAAPDFQLPQLHQPDKTFSPREMRGKVWLLNVWASWCFSCRDEHPFLLELQRSSPIPIYGLNTKNNRDEALAWLGELGNPYVLSAADLDGRVSIDYGVYGAPETFLIDKDGVIRFKQIGPITPDVWNKQILPLAQELNR